ncbi:MAG: molybdopterin-dependent oxidoreductase [Thermosphaera sp.]
MRCYAVEEKGTRLKGIDVVIDCRVEDERVDCTNDIIRLAEKVFRIVFGTHDGFNIAFESNEPIGNKHILYRLRIPIDSEKYIGVRIVSRYNVVKRVLFTLPIGLREKLKLNPTPYDPPTFINNDGERNNEVPGQTYIPDLIVYNILGVPKFSLTEWRLEVSGLVENPVKLTLKDLYELGTRDYTIDFHCVTGWSVKNIAMRGVPFEKIINMVKPASNVKWVYTQGMDGYATVFPYQEVFKSSAFLALEMNGRPLEFLHGYPVRLIIPHLYGWKSAKWLKNIVFTDKYVDGYWEALGYHPRGDVSREERFKEY